MKRKTIAIILTVIAIAGIGFFSYKSWTSRQLTNTKLAELNISASQTEQSLQLGSPLERLETDKGYYEIKGGQHYQWSIMDAFSLSDVGLPAIENIDNIMTNNGWNRVALLGEVNPIASDYASARQWDNSFELHYSKPTTTTPMCQRFSFWWQPQSLDSGKAANLFIYTEFTDFCKL